MDELYKQLAALAKRHGAKKLVLYGSRARGDNRYNSDIDLAVYGMPQKEQSAFCWEADELPTLLKLDIVFITSNMDPAFVHNIEKDGVDLMNKFREKYTQFVSALARLREAINDYDNTGLDSIRDGAIQRFEFCTELAWKTMREYLLDQGYTELNSPKSTIRKAYAAEMFTDETGWLQLLDDRNLTSHVYDEETARKIFDHIKETHLKLFDDVIEYMK